MFLIVETSRMIWTVYISISTISLVMDKRRIKVLNNHVDPSLCDTLFYIGKNEKPVCVIGGIMALQSQYFRKLLYNNVYNEEHKHQLTNQILSLMRLIVTHIHILKKYSMNQMSRSKVSKRL